MSLLIIVAIMDQIIRWGKMMRLGIFLTSLHGWTLGTQVKEVLLKDKQKLVWEWIVLNLIGKEVLKYASAYVDDSNGSGRAYTYRWWRYR